MHFPGFIGYFLRTWATNIHMWTAVILYLMKLDNQLCLLLNL